MRVHIRYYECSARAALIQADALARAERGVDSVPLFFALLLGHGAVEGGGRADALCREVAVRSAEFGARDVSREGVVQTTPRFPRRIG